jgi:hypothetical protein
MRRLQQIVIERYRCSHTFSFHTNDSAATHRILVLLWLGFGLEVLMNSMPFKGKAESRAAYAVRDEMGVLLHLVPSMPSGGRTIHASPFSGRSGGLSCWLGVKVKRQQQKMR